MLQAAEITNTSVLLAPKYHLTKPLQLVIYCHVEQVSMAMTMTTARMGHALLYGARMRPLSGTTLVSSLPST
jgi:hypothetical protein